MCLPSSWCRASPTWGEIALTWRQAQRKDGLTYLSRKFLLLGPPFITQSRVVFLYLNVKTKKIIYMGVQICVVFFPKGGKAFWSWRARFAVNSLEIRISYWVETWYSLTATIGLPCALPTLLQLGVDTGRLTGGKHGVEGGVTWALWLWFKRHTCTHRGLEIKSWLVNLHVTDKGLLGLFSDGTSMSLKQAFWYIKIF